MGDKFKRTNSWKNRHSIKPKIYEIEKRKIYFAAILPLLLWFSPIPSFSLSSEYKDEVLLCPVLSTILVPSLNLVLNNTFAFVNSPSFNETTINCDPLNRVRNNWPICCVWLKSRAASISSKMYIGAGLNWRRDMIRERAISERWPPLSSVRLCFQTDPRRTLTSRPCVRSSPSGGWSFAKFPGRSSAKISPKSLWKRR